MKKLLIAAVALAAAASPALAGPLTLELEPKDGKILRAVSGMQAVDSRTASALVRVISPGQKVTKRATVRVLIMNLGSKPFSFGPRNVSLKLADGTSVPFMHLAEFRDGIQLVQRETARQSSVRSRIDNNLDGINTSGASVPNGQSLSQNAAANSTTRASELDIPTDSAIASADRLQGAVDSIIATTSTLAPKQATGGYMMFELPDSVRRSKADQPVELIVSAAGEEHHFSAVLRRH
jgi:hypothetical protein